MKTLPSCLCILGLTASTAMGGAVVLLDQIGPDDGANIGTGGFANQYFAQPVNSAYNVGCIDDFDNQSGFEATSVQTVIFGYNGYVGIDGVSGYQVNFYNSNTSAGTSLAGDVTSEDIAGPFSSDPNWALAGFDLVGLTPSAGFWATGAPGIQYVSAIPTNEFGTNGQTAAAESLSGDGLSWQANPNGGFGFGTIQQLPNNIALRVLGGSGNPCDLPLSLECAADVSGPNGVPDGIVGVDDVLTIIGTFGEQGDGSSRPQGDCRPLPNGNCLVDVDDLLGCIGEYGEDCRPRGACCFGVAGCDADVLEADCLGDYLGDGSTCADCFTGACCTPDGSDCFVSTPEDCVAAGNIYRGNDVLCADIDCIPVPVNNSCDGAIALSPNVNGTASEGIDITYATTVGPENDNCSGFPRQLFNDLYYTFTADRSGELLVSTCNQVDFDSVIEVWSACPSAGGVVLACNDDGPGTCATDFTSELTLPCTSGDSFVIRVGAFDDTYGTAASGVLTVTAREIVEQACCVEEDCYDLLPLDCVAFGGESEGFGTACNDGETQCGTPNNTCETATQTTCDSTNSFDTSGAADSGFGVPDDTQCAGTYLDWGTSPDVWFTFTPSESGTVTVSLCDAVSYDTSLVLYAGSDCTSLSQIACNGDASQETGCQSFYSGIYDFPVTGGVSLYVRIGGWQGATGPGTLTISCVGQNATGACCLPDSSCLEGQTAAECAALDGSWNNGVPCAEIECPDDVRCSTGNGLGPMTPDEAWNAGTSNNIGGVPNPLQRAMGVSAASVNDLSVAGLTLLFDAAAGFGACPDATPIGVEMQLMDGTFNALQTIAADGYQETNLLYSGAFPLSVWSATGIGYVGQVDHVSAYSTNAATGECWFLWMASSTDGSANSFTNDGTTGWIEADPTAPVGLNYCISATP